MGYFELFREEGVLGGGVFLEELEGLEEDLGAGVDLFVDLGLVGG